MRSLVAAGLIAGMCALVTSAGASEPECKGGCATAQRAHAPLAPEELTAWLQAYAEDPAKAPEVALETLLFHGAQVRAHLKKRGPGPLPADHHRFLMAELAKTHARVEVKLVDRAGKVRATLPAQEVRVGEKAHLVAPATPWLQSFEYSGTVERVGLKHMWGRL